MAQQVIKQRIRGFISLTAHPDGCAARVGDEVAVAQAGVAPAVIATGTDGGSSRPLNVLVIGSSTGYGLASVLCSTFGWGAKTLGVCLERPSEETKAGSAGWYNLAAAHGLAAEQGRQLETINADAFAPETKELALAALRERFGPLDLVIYSLAAPRRVGPGGEVWQSALKPIGTHYSGKTIDLRKHAVVPADIEPANDDEIAATVRVMGGDDWADWISALGDADLLAPGCRTVAYSYIGPEMTYAIYRDGTIGRAKQHLAETATRIRARLAGIGGDAWVSVNKAVVTQASAAIPGVTLYMSILFQQMKARGTHEGTIEQIVRLFADHLAPGQTPELDGDGLIRLDDLEMEPAVQAAVTEALGRIDTETLRELSDYDGYGSDFAALFGFGLPGIDYDAPTEVDRPITPA